MAGLSEVLRTLDGRHTAAEAIATYAAALADIQAERRQAYGALGVDDDEAWPASRLYHRESGIYPGWSSPLSTEEAAALTLDLQYRRYPGAPRVALPDDVSAGPASIAQLLQRRRSAPTFSDEPLSLRHLATLLRFGCGVTDARLVPPRRAAPSPGALYPIEAYVLAMAVEGLDPCVYHYLPLEHELERLHAFGESSPLPRLLQPGLHDATPAVMIVLTAVLSRVQRKYGERGYRFAHLEAGHIGQNLSLVAASLSLAGRCIGGFCDGGVTRELRLDGDEIGVYGFLAGPSPMRPGAQDQ